MDHKHVITRPRAVALVKRLTPHQRMVAWGVAWDYSDQEMAEIMGLTIAVTQALVSEVEECLQCSRSGIALVLILAEGVRKAELSEWPGNRTRPFVGDK